MVYMQQAKKTGQLEKLVLFCNGKNQQLEETNHFARTRYRQYRHVQGAVPDGYARHHQRGR